MKSFERPMMTLGAIFSIIMAILGWWVALHARASGYSGDGGDGVQALGGSVTSSFAPDPAAVVIACVGTLALICALLGWARRAMMLTAGGVLGCGLLFPTGFGFVPMIIGGVIALLMMALKVFEMIEGED